jgi:hypothetical protein
MKIQKTSLIPYICIEVVCLFSILAVLYFEYIAKVERQTIQTNAEILVNHSVDLFNVCTAAIPPVTRINIATDLLQAIKHADRGEASYDEKILQTNKLLKARTIQVGVALGCTVLIVLLALMYFKVITLEPIKLLQFTVVGGAVLVIAEVYMISFIGTRYNPLDINKFLQMLGGELKKANATYPVAV